MTDDRLEVRSEQELLLADGYLLAQRSNIYIGRMGFQERLPTLITIVYPLCEQPPSPHELGI